jgi:hypothetical protein
MCQYEEHLATACEITEEIVFEPAIRYAATERCPGETGARDRRNVGKSGTRPPVADIFPDFTPYMVNP